MKTISEAVRVTSSFRIVIASLVGFITSHRVATSSDLMKATGDQVLRLGPAIDRSGDQMAIAPHVRSIASDLTTITS